MVGGEAPNEEDLSLVCEGAYCRGLGSNCLSSSHLQAVGRKKAYKELFEKIAEDVGFVLRKCEGI